MLVEVTDGQDRVLVAKEGDDLVIRVREGGMVGSRVFVRTPLRALAEAASACEETGDAAAIRCDPRRMARR